MFQYKLPNEEGEGKKLSCKICGKEAVADDYCKLHKKAYESIIRKYENWNHALEISWKEYLSEIANNLLTGEFARQVAEYFVKSGEK